MPKSTGASVFVSHKSLELLHTPVNITEDNPERIPTFTVTLRRGASFSFSVRFQKAPPQPSVIPQIL